MGGGSLILTLYVLCAIGVVVLIAIGLVLFLIGRKREAQGRDQGRARKLAGVDAERTGTPGASLEPDE